MSEPERDSAFPAQPSQASSTAEQTWPPYQPHPELAARVRALGLEQNVADLRDLGFTVIHGLSPDITDRLRRAIKASTNPAADALGQDPVWVEAITDTKLLTLAEVSVGKGCLISQVVGGVKPKGGYSFGLHVDQNWTPAPFPEHTQMVTFCWVTDDAYESEAGGPTMVVPGSHKLRRHPTAAEAARAAGAQPILAPRASVAVWRGETWHGSYPRQVEGERVTAHISYARLSCRQIEDYAAFANEDWLRDKPAAMRTLFGLDDFLGKPPGLRMQLLRPTFEISRR
jgi:hypothetical protein